MERVTSSHQSLEPDASRTPSDQMIPEDAISQHRHRRRRAEWPSLDLALWQTPSQSVPTASAKVKAKQLIDTASAGCDLLYPYYEDGSVTGCLEMRDPDYEMILKLMYWCARQQSAIWDLFCILYERGFLYIEALAEPINWHSTPRGVASIGSALYSFEYIYQESNMSQPFMGWTSSQTAVTWLAIMIGRKSSDIGKLLDTMESTNILGSVNAERMAEHKTSSIHNIDIKCSLKMQAGSVAPEYFGFWLPHGLGYDRSTYGEKIRAGVRRFNWIEETYKEYFRLTDEQLLLEARQESYLRARPEMEPRLKHSGHWMPEQLASPPQSPSSSAGIRSIMESLI